MTINNQSISLSARQILLKRLSTAQAMAYTGPLGELIIDTTLKQVRVQDGVTPGGILMMTSSNIANLQSQIDNLRSNLDPAVIDSFTEIVANVNALLSNNTESSLTNSGFYANLTNTGNLVVDGAILPKAHLTQDLGSSTRAWRSLYLSNATAYFGNAALTITNNGLTVIANGNTLPIIGNIRFPDGSVQRSAVDQKTVANIFSLLTANVAANLVAINNDVSNAISYFGNIVSDAIVPIQSNLTVILNNADKLVSGNANVTLIGGTNPYTVFPAISSGENIYIQGGEIASSTGPIAVTSSNVIVLGTNSLNSIKNWYFDTEGNLMLPSGGVIGETNNTTVITPPTAAAGQSLVIRPTASLWSITSSGYIVYGSPITISVNLLSWAYFGTVNYTITGPGVTVQSLGRQLTGKVTFTGISAPDTQTVTWTIPANSNITEFTFTLTSVDGTQSTNITTENDPALYYNFEWNALPTGNFVTVTTNNISNSEASHVHLVAGNPVAVDLYLGDDNQYVKIEKNAGNVVIGTNLNSNNWTFDINGNLTVPGNINVADNIVGNVTTANIRFNDGSYLTSNKIYTKNNQFDIAFEFMASPAVSGETLSLNLSGMRVSGNNASISYKNNEFFEFDADSSNQRITFSNSTAYIKFGASTKDGTGTYNDLELWSYGGDDSHGNVFISAGSSPTNRRWAFNSFGNIVFPDGTIQSTAYTGQGGGGSSDRLINGNANVILTGGASPFVTFPTVATGENIVLQGGEIAVANGNAAITSANSVVINTDAFGNLKTWRFDQDGSITVPGIIKGYQTYLGGSPYNEMVTIQPSSEINKTFRFMTDQSSGTWTRSIMEFPDAEVNKAVLLGFPHSNGSVGYVYNQGTDTITNTEFNNAFNIMANGIDVKISVLSLSGNKVWKFDANGAVTFPDSTIQSTAASTGRLSFANVAVRGYSGTQLTFATDGYFTSSQNTEALGYFYVVNNSTNQSITAGWTVVGAQCNTTVSSTQFPVAGYPGVIKINLTTPASGTSGFYPVTVTSPDKQRVEIQPDPIAATKFVFTTTGIIFPDTTIQASAFTGNANAVTVDITNTNGLGTTYYPTFVENRTNSQYLRADIDLTYRTDTNILGVGNLQLSTSGNIRFADSTVQSTAWTRAAASVQSTPPASPVTGQLYYDTDDGRTYIYTGSAWIDSNPAGAGGGTTLKETFGTLTLATGVVTHDCTTNRLFYHSGIAANFTANFTNLGLAAGEATSVTLVLVQGGTARIANAVQIGGTSQTIVWQGASSAPTGNASRTDIMTFSILCTATNTYTVLGMLTSFGGV